jgi:mannose/fructose/N-acetylgalactosamine-specific phosphotransferase system component IIC
VTGLDGVSFVQSMISRPIVAGPLAGLLLGDAQAGMMAGVVLEILSLHQLPIGASRHWDTGPAAVTAAVALTGVPGAVGLVIAAGLGVAVGWAGSWTVQAMRHLNARLVVAAEGQTLSASQLERRHLSAMVVDFGRACLLTVVAVSATWLLVRDTGATPLAVGRVAGLAALGLASLALGADVRMVAGGRRVWTAFGVAAAASATLWLWLH